MLQAIRLLGAMVTPSYLLAEGYVGVTRINFGSVATRSDSVGSDHSPPSPLDIQQRIARTRLRACNGIRPLLQLLNYRRSVAHVEFIRLATIKVGYLNRHRYDLFYVTIMMLCTLGITRYRGRSRDK